MRAIVLEKFGGPDSLIIKGQALTSRRALDLAPASVFRDLPVTVEKLLCKIPRDALVSACGRDQ